MDKLTGISEPTVTLPIGMDCREYKLPMTEIPEWMHKFLLEYWKAERGSK